MHRDICQSRLIWSQLLQQLAAEEYLMPCTFDIDAMSTAEILRTATRSYRFRFALLNDGLRHLSSHPVLLNYGPSPVEGEPWAEQIHRGRNPLLLPGGRWLITFASCASWFHIFCFDLSTENGTGMIKRLRKSL